MAVQADLLPSRYRGPQRIGRGGMGEIYRATDEMLGRAVAIKVLADRYAQDEAVRQRFTREALAAARLSGAPNTVTIYDVGEHNERPFIVMEYLGGGSLETKIRAAGPQPVGQVLEWLEQAGRALDAAHAAGVVHRDVKPANLLLDRDGVVHAADFGIASAAGMQSLTMTGTVLGTAGYLAPEQARGERATPASDRYALAVVAWELLTGDRPYAADSTTAEAAAHVNSPVPSICDRSNEQVPCELDPVFERALAKDPVQRYSSCAEFVQAMRQAMDEAAGQTGALGAVTAPTRPVERRPAAPPPRPPARYAPHPPRASWGRPLLVLLGIAALGGGIAAAVLATRGGDSRSAASPTVRTVVKRVTTPGTTVQVTTTAPTTAPAASTAGSPPATTTTEAASSESGHTLNDQGYSLMQHGDYQSALPLLQQAVQKLQGSGPSDPYEGYANYNLGYTLLQLGQCADAVSPLQRAQQLEPDRHEPRQALKKAQKCAGEGD